MYGLSGWILSWLTGRPLVLNVDAPLIEEYEQLQGARLGRVRRAVARWILRRNLSRAGHDQRDNDLLSDNSQSIREHQQRRPCRNISRPLPNRIR